MLPRPEPGGHLRSTDLRKAAAAFLPREHGAWVMLALGLGTGWALRGRLDPVGIALTLGWILLFLGQEGWARRGLALSTLLVSGAGALLLGAAALFDGPDTQLALGLSALTGSVAMALRTRSRTAGRVPLFAWSVHLAASVAMASPVALLGGTADASLLAAGATASGFGAGVLAVRSRRSPEAGSRALILWSLVGLLLWPLFAPASPAWLGALAFPVRLLQLHLQPRLSWKAVGWSETALGLWLAFWLCL